MEENNDYGFDFGDDLTNDDVILSKNERIILSLIRKAQTQSILIKIKDGVPSFIEVTYVKRVFVEARLTDILQKKKYQELTIKTADGSIAHATLKTIIKLEKETN